MGVTPPEGVADLFGRIGWQNFKKRAARAGEFMEVARKYAKKSKEAAFTKSLR
jgi:alkanesulfonate monooxygenase SsuD/methylene tetrahydromethanopterin reductase-like flavin-dependent oxidoreductase (luciferase family)